MKTVFAVCFATTALLASSYTSAFDIPGPERAVAMAIRAAPSPIPRGLYQMDIKSVGHSMGYTFLNSEGDYKDTRNLSIQLSPSAGAELKRTLNVDNLDAILKDKHIQVDGALWRVKVAPTEDVKRTGNFRYGARIFVENADQIHLIN